MKKNNEQLLSELGSDGFMTKFESRLALEPNPDWSQAGAFEIPWIQIAVAAVVAIIMSSEYNTFHQVFLSLGWNSGFFFILGGVVLLGYALWPKLNIDISIFSEINDWLDT